MHEITASTQGGMRVEASDGVRTMTMDEPADQGGSDAGLSPTKTLAAALGGCTALTLKLYSARKSWPLEDVKVRVQIEPADRADPESANRVTQTVELIGPLDEAQRERLLLIAGKCPVHKLLEGPSMFEERLLESAAEA